MTNIISDEILKDLAYYQALRYRIVLEAYEDGTWGAIIPDLKGCVGGGDTIEAALIQLEAAKSAWLMSHLQHGDAIPEPSLATIAEPMPTQLDAQANSTGEIQLQLSSGWANRRVQVLLLAR